MKLYISHLCPDCPPAMEHLNSRQVQYELLDIQKDISVLKEFLKKGIIKKSLNLSERVVI